MVRAAPVSNNAEIDGPSRSGDTDNDICGRELEDVMGMGLRAELL